MSILFNQESAVSIFKDFCENANSSDHKIFASRVTNGLVEVLYVSPQELASTNAKKLRPEVVFQKTGEIFQKLKDSQEMEACLGGLIKIHEKRERKFQQLPFFCRWIRDLIFGFHKSQKALKEHFFSLDGLKRDAQTREFEIRRQTELEIQKREAEQKELLRREEQSRQLSTICKDLANADYNFGEFDLSECDAFPADLLANSSYHLLKEPIEGAEQKTTAVLFIEKACEKLIEQGKVQAALDLRKELQKSLPPAERFREIYAETQKNQDALLGYKLSGSSAVSLKNNVLHSQIRTNQQGQPYLYVEGKLTHQAKQKLEAFLQRLNPKDLEIDGKQISREQFEYRYFKRMPEGHFVSFWDLSPADRYAFDKFTDVAASHNFIVDKTAFIQIGADKKNYCGYNQFSVELHPDASSEAVYWLYSIFAFFGLADVAQAQRACDDKRKQILQVFRTAITHGHWRIERDKSTFEKPVQKLQEVIQSFSYSKDLLQKYSEQNSLYQQSIYPHFSMWAIKGFANELRQKQTLGLMAGVGSTGILDNYPYSETFTPFEEAAHNVASMLKSGMLSSQDRFQLGLIRSGISSHTDLESGGGDSVFARFVMKPWLKKIAVSGYTFSGKIQVLLSLKVLERGGYGKTHDVFGAKQSYQHGIGRVYLSAEQYRENLLRLTGELAKFEHHKTHNEVCIKHRVPPEFICGLHVKTEGERSQLIAILTKEGVVDSQNQILGVPVMQFIHAGSHFHEEEWKIDRQVD